MRGTLRLRLQRVQAVAGRVDDGDAAAARAATFDEHPAAPAIARAATFDERSAAHPAAHPAARSRLARSLA